MVMLISVSSSWQPHMDAEHTAWDHLEQLVDPEPGTGKGPLSPAGFQVPAAAVSLPWASDLFFLADSPEFI